MGSFIPFLTFKGMGSALCCNKNNYCGIFDKSTTIGTDVDYVMPLTQMSTHVIKQTINVTNLVMQQCMISS